MFGSNHLAIRLLVQLGLRPEEAFALRKNDARGAELVIDEAIVDGATKEPKTLASAATMYITPDLAIELKHHLETIQDPERSCPIQQEQCPDATGEFP